MLSFASLANELKSDLDQQYLKLDIFARNNFIWLEKIHKSIDADFKKRTDEERQEVTVQNHISTENQPKITRIQNENPNLIESAKSIKPGQNPINLQPDKSKHQVKRSSLKVRAPKRRNENEFGLSDDYRNTNDTKRHVSFSCSSEFNRVNLKTPKMSQIEIESQEIKCEEDNLSGPNTFQFDNQCYKHQSTSKEQIYTSPKFHVNVIDAMEHDNKQLDTVKRKLQQSIKKYFSIEEDADKLKQEAKRRRDKWAKMVENRKCEKTDKKE